MRPVKSNSTAGRAAIAVLINRGQAAGSRVEPAVRAILDGVRRKGDVALRRYAVTLDGLNPRQPFAVPQTELRNALHGLRKSDPQFVTALQVAADNIRNFAQWQRPQEWSRELQTGVHVGQLVRPLESVGCYVPGGRYPLPSTLLMTVIPAQVAGVQRIAVVSPRPAQHTLAAAAFLGVTEFYRIGGAQAVAALAYGTRSIPTVDKIVGPGNSYVTAAKRLCGCPIDMLAGPTEALIVSHTGNAAFIAADLVAQAEHDVETSVAFITTSASLAKDVAAEVKRLSAANPTAQKALQQNGYIIVTASRSEAMDLANAIASEHLTVDREDAARVRSAGSLFVGDYSAQPAGDYASGPNHVLPTGGLARARGGLSVSDFVKVITVQQLSRTGLRSIGASIIRLAEAEGLRAHAQAIQVRMGGTRA